MSVPSSVLIVTPVYDDWAAVRQLLRDFEALPDGITFSLLLVDDGSTETPNLDASEPANTLDTIHLLRLTRNLGHQRAIAVGLAYAHEHLSFDAIVVMDSDGEDRPEDIATLLDAYRDSGGDRIWFARRRKRSERWSFRVFYLIYLFVFRVLTGFVERTGNFSIIPRAAVRSLVTAPEIWMHYASAVSKMRQPYGTVAVSRGRRYAGRSRMNLTGLIVHGLQAVAVHREVVAVRLFLFCLASAGVLFAGMVAVVAIRFFTDLAIPGWATTLGGILVILLGQILGLGLYSIFIVLGSRSDMPFIPVRDYATFVQRCRRLDLSAAGAPAAPLRSAS